MFYQRLGLVLSLAVCLLEVASAVKCYQCESTMIKQCGDSPDLDMLQIVDCTKTPRPRNIVGTKNSTSCVKMAKDVAGSTHIIRGCFFENAMDTKSKCMVDPGAPVQYKLCETCTTDFCNGSATYGPVAVVMLLAAFLGQRLLL